MVCRIIGHAESIKGDTHCFEDFFEVGVIFFTDGTRCCVFCFGSDNDRRSMVIGSADEDNVIAETSEIAHIKVAWYVSTEVPEMAKTVCVGQTTRNDSGLIVHEILFGVEWY